MNYENYVKNLCKTPKGRLYLLTLANTFKEEKDVKSLQYLFACVEGSGEAGEIKRLSEKIQSLLNVVIN